LKVENLQSRYDALTNQINPHFFFNSLNGIAALIRGKRKMSPWPMLINYQTFSGIYFRVKKKAWLLT
jgi:LytS/YehU family sensor histidine kinase